MVRRRNTPPPLDVEEEIRMAQRAGMPLRMAQPEDELEDVGGDFPHYIGQRMGLGMARVIRVEANGERKALSPRFDLANHSPDGFEWGYGGSGPAQLALAILADFLRDDRAALEHYQQFKFALVAGLTADRWTINANQVRAAYERVKESA